MNRTKKLTAALLACLMVFLLAVTACKPAQDEPSNGRNEARATDAPLTEPTAEPSAEPTAEITAEPEPEPVLTDTPMVIPETVVIDDEYCTFIILGMEADTIDGFTLQAYLENKTEDCEITFHISQAFVNGLEVDPVFVASIGPGKNDIGEIRFVDELPYDDELLYELIPVFTDIELYLSVEKFDYSINEGEGKGLYYHEPVHIYPYGEDNATKFVRETQPTDTVIMDNEQFTFIVTGRDQDGYWPITLKAYLVNRTDSTVMVSVQRARINGVACDPYWASEMVPGTSTFINVFWSAAELNASGIDPDVEIETIEMDLRIYEADSYGSPLFEGTVTLHP